MKPKESALSRVRFRSALLGLPILLLALATALTGCRGGDAQSQSVDVDAFPAPSSREEAEASPQPMVATTTERMVRAARGFLSALSPDQRGTAEFALDDAVERTRWSNLPASMVERSGLRLGDLTDLQKRRLHDLLRASTSSQGYQKIAGRDPAGRDVARGSVGGCGRRRAPTPVPARRELDIGQLLGLVLRTTRRPGVGLAHQRPPSGRQLHGGRRPSRFHAPVSWSRAPRDRARLGGRLAGARQRRRTGPATAAGVG